MRRSLRHSLASELRARIRSGEWRPGERIPSEPELARRRTVSRSSMPRISATARGAGSVPELSWSVPGCSPSEAIMRETPKLRPSSFGSAGRCVTYVPEPCRRET